MTVSRHVLDLLARIKRRALLMAEIERLDGTVEECFEAGRYDDLDVLLAERKALFGRYLGTFGPGFGVMSRGEEGAENE